MNYYLRFPKYFLSLVNVLIVTAILSLILQEDLVGIILATDAASEEVSNLVRFRRPHYSGQNRWPNSKLGHLSMKQHDIL